MLRQGLGRLQRGRAVFGAEIRCQAEMNKPAPALQRGRAVFGAEMVPGESLRLGHVLASTGPRRFWRGDAWLGETATRAKTLQRGRAVFGAEIRSVMERAFSLATLQRGRAVFGAEIFHLCKKTTS